MFIVSVTGKVTRIQADAAEEDLNKYFVAFDDGDEGFCSRLMIKRENDRQSRKLAVGQLVLAKFTGLLC
jgi:hypothetical protein